MFCLLLAPSHRTEPESVAVGGGGGSGVGSGGEPLRYAFTVRGWGALHPWTDTSYAYSMLQINMGSNPLSRIEVVSGLNLSNQARHMYHYNPNVMPKKYAPKVYLGTPQVLGTGWNSDSQKGINYPSNWPLNVSQKGETKMKYNRKYLRLLSE